MPYKLEPYRDVVGISTVYYGDTRAEIKEKIDGLSARELDLAVQYLLFSHLKNLTGDEVARLKST